MTFDPKTVSLGKQPYKHDDRTLLAEDYFGNVSPPPTEVDNMSKVPQWVLGKNDELGDCVPTGFANSTCLWSFNSSGNEVIISDAEVVSAYSAISGYDPSKVQPDDSNPTDNGCVMLDAINWYKSTGINGHKIAAFVKINPKNEAQVKQAINLFGCIYVGLQLPNTIQDQTGPTKCWTVESTTGDGAPGSLGGHCVAIGYYDAIALSCVTWQNPQKMDWNFFQTYCDEAYILLDEDWLNGGKDPQGFDMAQLQSDLVAVGANKPTPSPEPPFPVPPIPEPTPVPVSNTVTVSFDPATMAKVKTYAKRRDESVEMYVEATVKNHFRTLGLLFDEFLD